MSNNNELTPTHVKIIGQQLLISFGVGLGIGLRIPFYAAQEGSIRVNCAEQIARKYVLNRRTKAALKKYAIKQNKKYYRKPVSVGPWETLEGENYLFHY